ncbi:cadherin-86C-like [Polyergus mexicanus]|uniref:cadherin-86C-like n=1 Tax=Polyergus mexicanus TaxID=615972 RepID=UPI0038B50C73
MPLVEAWFKVWIYFGLICGWGESARPRFDTSTDMGLVLVPADAEVDSVIFRLRATDQDADFPLVFEITATITPVVRIDNLPCTLYNKVCQANVILTKRLMPGRLHDFAVRVRDTKGDSNSMQATISATNATTSRDKIFPHIPSLIMVPEDTKPDTELDYLLVRANSWSGKPVYIELWQPKELFTIRQRQTPTQTRGVITLIGELDFETQSMYTLTIYATDPYTEPGKDTRNIAGLNIVIIVQDVQDVPPIFTLAPPLTRLNNSVQTGDVILRVHAEDGDKGVPREITYGLVSEGNPFIPFFNISETTGEIILARPLEELTQITHIGAPVVLTVVAEEIRRSRDEPPAQATVVEVGFLLGEPGNSPPYFENDNYIASIPENLEPGSVITFPEQYSAKIHDEDIGKAGVFALKLRNNNGTFEINPTVAERTADFIITVRDNTLIDYEMYKSLSFKIVAQEVGPATNLSATAAVVIFIQDVNDNSPIFDEESYEVTLPENVTVGTRVIQVHATDKDTGLFGSIQYTGITGQGSDAFTIDSDTGLITVAMGSSLDREMTAQLQLTVHATDENGKGNTGVAFLIVNLLDVNDNAPIFEKNAYEFTLNSDLTNFTTPAIIKATDADAEPPNNEIRYELIQGNYENKFYLNEITGELILCSPITTFRRKKQSVYDKSPKKLYKEFFQSEHAIRGNVLRTTVFPDITNSTESILNEIEFKHKVNEIRKYRRRRAETDILYTLTARAYDLGVPHLSSETEISIVRRTAMEARIMMFVVPGEHPNLTRTAETLATITGGRITVLNTRPYVPDNKTGVTDNAVSMQGKRTIVIARVEQTEVGTPLVDVEKIRNTLAANGVGIIGGTGTTNVSVIYNDEITTKLPIDRVIHKGGDNTRTYVNKTITNVHEEVTVYKAENKLLFWLLIILGLLMLLAIAALIICCICPGCPFYMAPRKRRIYSSEKLIARFNGRPKRHLHREPMATIEITSNGRKQAWSADPAQRNWQFNRRNIKNGGLASLPGDVVYISERPPIDQANVESLRLRDGPAHDPSRRRRMEEQERMYVEDVEERKVRDYDATDADSLQRHEMERGSDILHQAYRQRYVDPESNNEVAVREQHFYREGNAEVLQLVTRGQVEDTNQHHYPTTFIVDGKDVLLQRFMQDQKARQELSMQEPEVLRTVESHQHPRNLYQYKQEILLLPEELEDRRRGAEELDSNAQKLTMDDGYAARKIDLESQMREVHRQEISMNMPGISDKTSVPKDQTVQSATMQSFHDLELARQNVLLTRLLLERESRYPGGITMDAVSYLETQSLPGQAVIATQTERTAATQTERHIRSRSDNDESDEDIRNRKKMKSKKRYDEEKLKRTRTLWMKSPIEEEENPCFDKRLNILRKKVKEVKERRKASLQPKILREISDSLDENGSTCHEREGKSVKTCQQPIEETSIAYKMLREKKNGSSSSIEVGRQQDEKTFDTKETESLSSPEISVDNKKYIQERVEKKSSRKESKLKKQKKIESVIKPSFRVLEKEITTLTKRLSKLADKKIQEATRDESTNQEKSRTSEDFKKDLRTSKKIDDSKKRKQFETSPDIAKEAKTEKFIYHQPQIMSPGSTEYEDPFEKPTKSKSEFRQKFAKHKQTSHMRTKKQTQKVREKQIAQQDREPEKCKNAASKENSRSSIEKTAKLLSRTHKLATIGRRKHVSKEPSTSTSSDRINGKEDLFVGRDSDKRSAGSSEISSHHVSQQKQKLDHVSERFSDDFVTEPQRKDTDRQAALHSTMDISTHKKGIVNDKKIIQFSDDFTIETQKKDMEHQMQTAIESEIGQSACSDSGKDHVTLKEIVEDILFFQDLKYIQPESEITLDTAKKREFETSNIEDLDSKKRTIPLDSPVLETLKEDQIERPSSHIDKNDIEDKIAYMSEKHEEETKKHEIEKEMLEKEKITLDDTLELKTLEDVEKIMRKEIDIPEQYVKSPKISDDVMEHHVKQIEEYKKNDLYSDTITSLSKMEKDLKDIKDVTHLLYAEEEDKIVCKPESDQKEELSHESMKEHSEEEMPSAEITIGTKQDDGKMIKKLVPKENEEDSSRTIKSDEKMKITKSDTDGYQNVIEKPKEILKEYVTQDLEKMKKDVESITETFEKSFNVRRSSLDDSVNLTGIHRAFSIDDKTLKYIDDTSQEDDLSQSESGEIIHIVKEDTDKLKRSDDPNPKTEIESEEKSEEESRMSSQEISKLQETKLEKTIKLAKEKEESFLEQFQEKAEDSSLVKEIPDKEVKKIRDKELSTDQLPKDTDLEKSITSELEKLDKPATVAENIDVAESRGNGEHQIDVSVSIFSSFIDDTIDVLEESDSSSDISRKTTLTMRPYDTPRHRQRWQQQESLEIAGMSEIRTFKDGEDARVEIEMGEDTGSNISLDEIENIEDSIAIEATINESQTDTEIATTSEKISSNGERILSVYDLKKVSEIKKDSDFKSKFEESEDNIKSDIKDLLTTIQDKVLLIVSTKELSDTLKENVKDEILPITEENEECKSEIATSLKKIEKVFEPMQENNKSKIKSSLKQAEEIDLTKDKKKTEDTKINKTRIKNSLDKMKTKDIEVDKIKNKDSKNGISKKHAGKTELFESSAKKRKKPERPKIPSPEERKRVLDEKSKEKGTPSHSHHRSRKSIDGDSEKKFRDGGSQKQTSRSEEEHPQKQAELLKSKFKKDKKLTIPSKTSEIDTSKTQSKYMAWYNKKRDETEKKRLEKKTAEDEEQLPRWVSRGLKQTVKQKEKQSIEHKTPEVTPRTRRKIKPLINVESEQLKAIVRQGRRLRKAEGNLEDDPPIQIFARTPPISTDTQHRLLQHSEYKYERVPPPFYLHPPPPAPHPSPELSPDRSLEIQPSTSQYKQSENELHSESTVAPLQSGTRLRHQQLLEKKSVFDIAYSEAAPSQLRSDSATPPS